MLQKIFAGMFFGFLFLAVEHQAFAQADVIQ
jgi:hypothetical protein